MTSIALISLFLTLDPYNVSHQPTEAQTKFWIQRNREMSRWDLKSPTETLVERPYAEFEEAKYLIMDIETRFSTEEAKRSIIDDLPQEIELVFIQRESNSILLNYAKRVLGNDRVHTISYHNGLGFWTRDALPIPTFVQSEHSTNFAVVDAEYYHKFDEDQKIADHFQAKILRHAYGFEGGNFLSDTHGRCLIVNNSRHAAIPDSIFKQYYGCQSVERFRYISGIGHIDERIKLLSNTLAVTDTTEYANRLKELGFDVYILPTSPGSMQSYVNSILLNKTIFVPIYNQDTDKEALKVYRDLGLKVVPVDATSLSIGQGSIHCISMTYPPAPFHQIEKLLSPNSE